MEFQLKEELSNHSPADIALIFYSPAVSSFAVCVIRQLLQSGIFC